MNILKKLIYQTIRWYWWVCTLSTHSTFIEVIDWNNKKFYKLYTEGDKVVGHKLIDNLGESAPTDIEFKTRDRKLTNLEKFPATGF